MITTTTVNIDAAAVAMTISVLVNGIVIIGEAMLPDTAAELVWDADADVKLLSSVRNLFGMRMQK